MSTEAGSIQGIACADLKQVIGVTKASIEIISGVGACAGGAVLYNIDNTDKLQYRTVCEVGTESGLDQGIIRTLSGGNWNCGAATVAEITSGDSAYIEMTPSFNLNGNNVHFMFGLGYVDTPPSTSTNAYAWMQWAVYCWAGTAAAAFESGVLKAGSGGAGPTWSADRAWRVGVDSNTVTIKYSDDSWGSSTTFHTFGTAVDIASNSNLVAGFSLYYAGTHPIENPKIYGALTNT